MILLIRIITKFIEIKKHILNWYVSNLVSISCKQCGENLMLTWPITYMGLTKVSIGKNLRGGCRLKIRTFSNWQDQNFQPEILIGDNVNIETDCHISAINKIVIDDNVLIASFVYISDHAHGETNENPCNTVPLERPLISKGPIHICKNVWIGEKVSILPGVTIGEGSIIGANSVVTKDIPAYSVAVGVPARVIKTLK